MQAVEPSSEWLLLRLRVGNHPFDGCDRKQPAEAATPTFRARWFPRRGAARAIAEQWAAPRASSPGVPLAMHCRTRRLAMSDHPTQCQGLPSTARGDGGFLLVTPTLVPHLRRGLLTEMGHAADALSLLTLSGEMIDEGAFDSVHWRIDGARRLLAKVGCSASNPSGELHLSSEDHPLLVYKALKEELELAVARAEGEAVEGRAARAVVDGELQAVVGALRVLLGESPGVLREAALYGRIGDNPIIASRGTALGHA
jgi:hypothetical protein